MKTTQLHIEMMKKELVKTVNKIVKMNQLGAEEQNTSSFAEKWVLLNKEAKSIINHLAKFGV
jgi:hypothetical protein